MLQRLQYTNPNIEYLFGKDIFEYDMSSAGESVIKKYKLVSDDDIHFMSIMEKNDRNIFIGNMKYRYDKIHDNINKALLKELQDFIRRNGISDDDIISSKRDALFVTKYSNDLKSDEVVFKLKNRYTSFINIFGTNLEIYYNSDHIDVKGIHDDKLPLHEDYFSSFIFTMMHMLESNDPSIKVFLNDFIMRYRALELDVGFYREFNSESRFRTKSNRHNRYYTFTSMGDDCVKDDLDISYNFNHLILPILNIVLTT